MVKIGDEIEGLGKVIEVTEVEMPSPAERYIRDGTRYGMSTYAMGYRKKQTLFVTDKIKEMVEKAKKKYGIK